MIDETLEVREMYRKKGASVELYTNTFFYEFNDIADIRKGLPEIGSSFKFEEGEKFKRIFARCFKKTDLELLIPDKKVFLLKDGTSAIGATSHLKNVKDILEKTNVIHGYVFGEAYFKDKGYTLFNELETLLLYAIFTEFDPSHARITPDSPNVELPRIPVNDPYGLMISA